MDRYMSKFDLKKIYRGNFNGTPAISTLKKAMLELFKGYPVFEYYGIFESYFGEVSGKEVVRILEKDGFIDVKIEENKQPQYKLTSKGIDLAVSMINLDYSENMHQFTVIIIVLTIITLLTTIIQLVKLF